MICTRIHYGSIHNARMGKKNVGRQYARLNYIIFHATLHYILYSILINAYCTYASGNRNNQRRGGVVRKKKK